jgi:hypothetical protein
VKYQIEIHSTILATQQVGFLMDLKSPSGVLSKQHIGIHRLLLFEIAVPMSGYGAMYCGD